MCCALSTVRFSATAGHADDLWKIPGRIEVCEKPSFRVFYTALWNSSTLPMRAPLGSRGARIEDC